MAEDQTEIVYCSGCGIAVDQQTEEVICLGTHKFCLWCWTNDCCRITRDAAESS